MLQILQHQKTGKLSLEDLPAPKLRQGGVLVQNVCSVISTGTERSSVQTARATIIGKARTRPDLVRQVMDNVKREGLKATYAKVQNRLDNYKELGYSSAGVVIKSSVRDFKPGDRVACGGTAHHAEVIFVPKHLAVRLPDGVEFEDAAFTTLAAIAMQGVRQADVRIGEHVAVIGLGLVGLLTVQLLRAAGCRVIGLDVSSGNFKLARKLGCEKCMESNTRSLAHIEAMTGGHGADAVLITAGTQSSDPIKLAMMLARRRSNVVVVGSVGMNIPRSPFYEKELNLRISSSYGPGRYDPQYEEDGIDYPIGYVRWTEHRNMQAVINLMSEGKLECKSLISHRFKIKDALDAYGIITGKRRAPHLGILIEYPRKHAEEAEKTRMPSRDAANKMKVAEGSSVIGFIGGGNFAQSYLLPYLRAANATFQGIAVRVPAHAMAIEKKFAFLYSTTTASEILDDPRINTVFIATRHDSHAQYVCEALRRKKHVFVEKPLAVSSEQLGQVEKEVARGHNRIHLLTGFNRRFSKPFEILRDVFGGRSGPMSILYRVNAGVLPPDHWIYHEKQGGRIIGECCHFIDCMSFLTGALPKSVFAESLQLQSAVGNPDENASIIIRLSDGSVGNLVYLANGDPSVPKEYCEISASGATAVMNDFREVIVFRDRKKRKYRLDGTKGHREEIIHFLDLVQGKARPLLTFESMYYTTLATLKILESLQSRAPVDI